MRNPGRAARLLAPLTFLLVLAAGTVARADIGASVTLASGAPSAIFPGEQTSL